METGVGRQYGNAEIGGHATVHQGDAHTSTALNISPGNTIHISVQGNIEWPPIARKRLLDTEDCERSLCTTKRKRLRNRDTCNRRSKPCETKSKRLLDSRDFGQAKCLKLTGVQDQDLREQGVHLINEILQSSGSRERVSLFSHEHADAHHVHALQHLRSTLRKSTKTKRGFLLTLVDRVRHSSLLPAIANVFPNSSAVARQKACQEAAMFPSSTDTIAPTTGCGPAQDLVCVFLAMLAMLSCREAGQGNSINSPLTSSSSKVSLIAGLITFALARYFCIPSMLQQMSELVGGSLIILDPFMRELRVPKAHVEHFTLLEAFLRVNLSGTTAEAFVEAGQFNLTLGQRHGRAISKTDWSVKGRIKSDQCVIMAVSLRRQDAKCVECEEQLTMAESGRFTCHLCGKAYGNCASLKYLTDNVRPNLAAHMLNKPRRSEISKPMPGGAQIEDDEEADDEYDLHGLQNIDLQILRRKGRYHLDSQAKLEEADHLDSTPPRSGLPHAAKEERTIKCICSDDDDDSLTIFCERCNTWQHIDCFYHQEAIPKTHLCVDCAIMASPGDIDDVQARQRQKAANELRRADKVAESVNSRPVDPFDSLFTFDYFGDPSSREIQDKLVSQDFESFFNEAYPLPYFGSPSHNYSDISGQQNQQSKKTNLMANADIAKQGDSSKSKTAKPSTLMTCNAIWDRLQSMEKFRNGEIDIDALCSELRAKAKCSEDGAVVEEKHVDEVLGWEWGT